MQLMKLVSILCLTDVLRVNSYDTEREEQDQRPVQFLATGAEQSMEIRNSYSKPQVYYTINTDKRLSYEKSLDPNSNTNSNGTRSDYEDEDRLVDPASRTLPDFKDRHPISSGILTTSAGRPIDIRFTSSNEFSELVESYYFIESIKHLAHERIPERTVNVKGIGAHGFFEVTHNIEKFTKAKLFEKVGKITPVFSRLGPGPIEKGQSDALPVALRGISFKFYTEEGNLDFLCIQVPIFNLRTPVLFPAAVHALNRKNPVNNLMDRTAFFDYITLHPEALHWLFWTASEFGLPKGLRHMNGFPIHTYEMYNENRESFFVRFKFLSELGYESLTLQEAKNISSIDPDFFIRDVYNSIEYKNFPSWKLEMDLLTDKQRREAKFNPFDITSLWPNGTYQTIPIGRIVLNRNVDNQFKDTEQSAFNPANLVPGIKAPPDIVFDGRRLAYMDSSTNRLGINFHNIEINRAQQTKTYYRDGSAPVLDNMKDAPSYYPNNFNGPVAYEDKAYPTRHIIPVENEPIDLQQARNFYCCVLQEDSQKQRLIDTLVEQIIQVLHPIQQRFTELLSKVDKDLARRFSESLSAAKKTKFLPAVIDDFTREKCEL